MRELLILSGKGGTGKTTVSSSFIKLSETKTFADCDVDAPNLHLSVGISGGHKTKSDFYGMDKAEIDNDKCVSCGKCMKFCRFNAIEHNGNYKINLYKCEGCGVCSAICPAKCINMTKYASGKLTLYKNGKTFSSAELKTGAGVSGKLVSEVKKQMRENAVPCDFSIIDGSPGIGCPVIASLSGVSAVIIVTEPTLSGLSDLKRIVETAAAFQPKMGVIINKYDVNTAICTDITKFCNGINVDVLGKIPYDKNVGRAINNGLTAVDVECPAGNAIKNIYKKTTALILKQEKENINENSSSK